MSVMGSYDENGEYTLSKEEFELVRDFACFFVSAEDAVRGEMVRTLYNHLTHECKLTGRDRDELYDWFLPLAGQSDSWQEE